MANIKSKSSLVVKQLDWHANMTDMNHLGKQLLLKPEYLGTVMDTIFTAKQYADNPLTSTLVGTGKEKTIDRTEWEWKLRGASTRPLVSMGADFDTTSITTVGAYRVEFNIYLDKNWFLPGDVIHPGTSNKKYQLRVQETPFRVSANKWRYRVQMVDNSMTGMPSSYLNSGHKWSKLYSTYEEGAEQSGSVQFSMPLALRNKMSRFRKHYRVTGDVRQTKAMSVMMADKSGKKHASWISYAEAEFWMQWYRELERAYWYNRDGSVEGATGRPVITGPGIQQQLEDSHIHEYNQLTGQLIEEYLMDIFYSRVKPGTQRNIKAYTGEYGMFEFHKAVQNQANKTGFIQVVDDKFIRNASSPFHANSLSFGYQFTKYEMANGITLELIHNPLYDDREINHEIDPVTGKPTESMRFTFLDFAGEGGESNIVRMKRENAYKLGYVQGLTGPAGPSKGGSNAHAGDYYEMHVQDECGIHIHDISKCGELILKRS